MREQGSEGAERELTSCEDGRWYVESGRERAVSEREKGVAEAGSLELSDLMADIILVC